MANLLFLFAALLILLPWHGFVFQTLWGWFIVPTFSVAPLTLPFAIGVAMVVRLLTITYKTDAKSPELLKSFLTGVFGYGLFLLIGWIVTLFI